MHIGSYDDEPRTLKLMDEFIKANSLSHDINDVRRHHEIYLSDPRKCDVSKLKTVIRVPVKK
ncbi:MAG: GyrI-like domain-containing protein [Treponema sp.]|nr:GyrI-like domain-containing protein [Treponema sp.]